MVTQVVPLIIPPGIHKNATRHSLPEKYIDADKIRFKRGYPEQVGGAVIEPMSLPSVIGCPRTLVSWSALNGSPYLGIGTSKRLYVANGGTYYDITPLAQTASLTDPFTTSVGVSLVTITDTLHGLREGDTINFASSVSYNGITFLGTYDVVEVLTANTYTIETGTNASGSGTGGGAVSIQYYITNGLCDSSAAGSGWSSGDYGEEAYGTPRSAGIVEEARLWFIDFWGEDILACPQGGALYYWDLSAGTGVRAAVVSTAPARNNFMLVSSTFRQCILFGTETVSSVFDPLLIRWSASEDYTNYTPSATNSAGEYRLAKGTKIVGAIETRTGEILVFTDVAVYSMRPTNSEAVFEVRLLAESSGLLSPKAVVEDKGIVYWASKEGFHFYDGVVRSLPCTLDTFIFSPESDGYYNTQQTAKFFFAKNKLHNEIWFFWADKNNIEINRYCIYNLNEDVFSIGTWSRLCWADSGTYNYPYAFDSLGRLLSHENGNSDNGVPLNGYVETGEFNIAEADSIMFVDKILPDGDFTSAMSLTFTYKKYTLGSETFTKTYSFTPTTPFINTRIKGRVISYKLQSPILNGFFRLGTLRASVAPDGRR